MHDFFQPIVDKIRENGFTGIIWAPGTGWQANYTSYASYPIEGPDIGYAVHDYTGWYGCSDSHCNPQDKINQFHAQ
ncbi:MAG: cellulase family glycosylhydrolase, partial [Bacilli bacterium]|nr:cellulase family glycosylhydrolase [Bacilli bacterium]